jgi:peptidoglycan/LPS O-acetylase OafA/YrhL
VTTESPEHDGPAPDVVHQPVRYHSLDAVRAVAMLLGLWLHGVIPYAGIDELPWAVRDGDGSPTLLLSIMVIHAFRMQVFFVMAGFFAHLLVERRGRRQFVRNRFIRVATPFMVAWGVLTPVLFVLWFIGWQITPPAPEFLDGTVAAERGFCVPTWHLWFLEYLLVMYVGALMLLPIGRALRVGRLLPYLRPLMLSPFRAVWLAVPTFGLLWLIPGWDSGPVEGCFLPEWLSLAYYSLFFAYGWVLFAFRDEVDRLGKGWVLHTVFGFVVLVPCLAIVYGAMEENPALLEDAAFQVLGHGVHTLLTCTLVFAFIGLFVSRMPQPSPTMRYVSDASYWLYLIHLPLQIAASIALVWLPVPGYVKLLIVLVSTTVLMLVTYHWCVRFTWIGRVLNGPRSPA